MMELHLQHSAHDSRASRIEFRQTLRRFLVTIVVEVNHA
jgi:hypothetical protein